MEGQGPHLQGQCPISPLLVQKPVAACSCASLCQWWERRRDILPSFTKACNLLMLPYHWLPQSRLPRVPSCYLPQYRQAVKMLAGILTLKWLKKTAGIRLTGLFGGFTLFFFLLLLFSFGLVLLFFFPPPKYSSQHYMSIQSSSADNGLVEANDGWRLVCRGAKHGTAGWGLSVGSVVICFLTE